MVDYCRQAIPDSDALFTAEPDAPTNEELLLTLPPMVKELRDKTAPA